MEYEVTRGGVVSRGGKVLKPWDNGRGYLILRVHGKTKAVHRLVAEKHLPNPKNLPEVNHKDGNKHHNHVDNLEWCTRGYNIKHAYDNNLRSATGQMNARAKIEESAVHEVCKLLQDGIKPSKIRDMGYPYSVVRNIKRKTNWKHISDLYF